MYLPINSAQRGKKNRYTYAEIQYILVDTHCAVRTDRWIRPVTVNVGSNTLAISDHRDHMREAL